MSDPTPATVPVKPHLFSTDPIEKLADALAKAQGEFPVIPKDSLVIVYTKEKPKSELYRYKYADLTTIISCTRPAMSKNGLSFTQGVVPGGFSTLIMHMSGQKIHTGFVPCDIPKNADMKQVAGLITYVKRISLTAALGVSADEDVDAAQIEANQGNATQKSNNKPGAQQAAKPPPGPTQAMLKRLYAIAGAAGWKPDAVRVYSLAKVQRTPSQLSKEQYDRLCKFLEGAPYDEMQAAEVENLYESLTDAQKKQLEQGGSNA